MSRLTVMQLWLLDAACLLPAVAAGVWLTAAFTGRRVFVPAGVPRPVSFYPASAPDWLMYVAFAVVIVLLAVSGLVIAPAIARAKARTGAQP